MLLEHVDERVLVLFGPERGREGHDRLVERTVRLDVGDAHPLQPFIVDVRELLGDDLAEQLVETRASLRSRIPLLYVATA